MNNVTTYFFQSAWLLKNFVHFRILSHNHDLKGLGHAILGNFVQTSNWQSKSLSFAKSRPHN